jgi:hypothetical protein
MDQFLYILKKKDRTLYFEEDGMRHDVFFLVFLQVSVGFC